MMNAPIFSWFLELIWTFFFMITVTLENFHTTLHIENIWALYHHHFLKSQKQQMRARKFLPDSQNDENREASPASGGGRNMVV